jgi:predicted aspartyl protease
MGRFAVNVKLTNNDDLVLARNQKIPKAQVRHAQVSGVVDSGASLLVLPKATVEELGLIPTGKVRVKYADGRRAKRDVVEGVRLELLGRQRTFEAIVEPKRKDALIGAIVMESLDLLVDCTNKKLIPREPDMILAEIE